MQSISDEIYCAWIGVAAIAVEATQEGLDFVTRRIYLIGADGKRVPIECFSPKGAGDIPVIVSHAAEEDAA